MKFKTDENLPVEAAAVFRDAGYDAETVWDEELAGTDDARLASRVRGEHRILVTRTWILPTSGLTHPKIIRASSYFG